MIFQIVKNIDSHLIKERVPSKYKNIAVSCASQLGNTCTLIIFPHDNRGAMKSGLVKKALRCLGELTSPQLVVVGDCFSIEAIKILNSKNALVLSLSEQY
jgi:hypothetical protein